MATLTEPQKALIQVHLKTLRKMRDRTRRSLEDFQHYKYTAYEGFDKGKLAGRVIGYDSEIEWLEMFLNIYDAEEKTEGISDEIV